MSLDAFKNEREYFAANGNFKTTVAAMDWASGEIERLTRERDELRAALLAIITSDPLTEADDWFKEWKRLVFHMKGIARAALEQSVPDCPDHPTGRMVDALGKRVCSSCGRSS